MACLCWRWTTQRLKTEEASERNPTRDPPFSTKSSSHAPNLGHQADRRQTAYKSPLMGMKSSAALQHVYRPLIRQELKGGLSALHYTRADVVKSPWRSTATWSTGPGLISTQTRTLSLPHTLKQLHIFCRLDPCLFHSFDLFVSLFSVWHELISLCSACRQILAVCLI